jgi:hypothetical protein
MKIPVLLAGPIVRRVEASNIYIMTVTSERFPKIHAEVFLAGDYECLPVRTVTNIMKFGKKLYINLTKIVPINDPFPTDQILCYNLTFYNHQKQLNLDDLGLLNNEMGILYGDLNYPSLYIKGRNSTAPILYGSCRKPHGKGEDALASGDLLMESVHQEISERPQALFMMGDQIYADDVAETLIPFISKLGNELTRKRECLSELDSEIIDADECIQVDEINGRKEIVSEAGFTSSASENHLIYLNEYLTMYLLNYSPDLWELFWEENKDLEEEQSKERKKEINEIKRFSQSVGHVRRLLANMPTYMIFDDHDITDDWNLSGEWKENVRNSTLGKLIVSNGLTAYWAFQAWGNDPSSFKKHFFRTLKDYIRHMDVTSDAYQQWSEMMWNYPKWEFYAPTTPRAIFMDIRTKREYEVQRDDLISKLNKEETEKLPRLINEVGWKNLSDCLYASGWTPDEQLIIISPTPVYGIEVIEQPVRRLIYPFERLGLDVRYMFDMEAWRYNKAGFRDVHQHVNEWGVKDLVILSGDVHYGFVYQHQLPCEDDAIKLTQYTSSPFKNRSVNLFVSILLNMAMFFYRLLDYAKKKIFHSKKAVGQYLWFAPFTAIMTKNNLGYLRYDGQHVISYYSRLKKRKYKLIRTKESKLSK